MKWALLSDIHANIQALNACEAHAQRQGAERWAVLGDLVGYGGDPLLVHASAHQPGEWRYVDNERAARQCLDAAMQGEQGRHVFVGHVHEQTLYYQGSGPGLMSFTPTAGVPVPLPKHRAWVATVGSVGQPRDGDPRAMYALYDDAADRLTFHRVPYDHWAAAAAVRKAGLPEFFATRLEEGR